MQTAVDQTETILSDIDACAVCCDAACKGNCLTVSEAAPKPPQLTRKQIGQLRRQYITIVHGYVRACGHKAKFNATKQPKNNCVECWKAFFMTVVDLEAVHKLLTEQGVKALEAKYGTKFMRNFHGFLSTMLNPGAQING
jgi:hypothetical protein